MRRRLTLASIGVLVLAAGVLLSPTSAADLPGNIPLDGCGTKQPQVDFDHAKHVEGTKCAECHHTQADLTVDSAETVATCVSCHKDPKDEAPDCSVWSLKENPYHVTCVGCHKKAVEKDAALTGKVPTKCTGCHVKEEEPTASS